MIGICNNWATFGSELAKIHTLKSGSTPISNPVATQEEIAKYTAERSLKAIKKDLENLKNNLEKTIEENNTKK